MSDPVPAAQPDWRLTIDEMVAHAQRVRDGNNSGGRSAWLLAGHLLSVAAELRRTEADLAVAVGVAAERGDEARKLRLQLDAARAGQPVIHYPAARACENHAALITQLEAQRQAVLSLCHNERYSGGWLHISEVRATLGAGGDTPTKADDHV